MVDRTNKMSTPGGPSL